MVSPSGGARVTSDLPFVSVLVPVYNDTRIRLCLEALQRQTYPADRREVFVIDNASTDDTPSIVRTFPFATLLHEEKRSSYAARNRGIAASRGQIVALTDADCIPDSDWLRRGVDELLKDSAVGLVAGHIEVFPRDARRPTGPELYEMFFAFRQDRCIREAQFGATANVFTRRSVIDAVGPFNDTLESGGDMEWGQRVAAKGCALVYSRDAVVRHPARHSWSDMLAILRRRARGQQIIGVSKDLRAWLLPVRRGIGSELMAIVRDSRLPISRRALAIAATARVWLTRRALTLGMLR
jgi:glycosyltransferase involved in cell wall biosynthesis